MKTIIIDGVEYDLTPKALFKKGDWIVYCNEDVDLITGIEDNGYLINEGGYIPFTCQGSMRYWTIQDAKDGDVLVSSSGKPFIFKGFFDNDPMAYGGLVADDSFWSASNSNWTTVYCKPATKEQRDLLFQKMKEAGYEWDAEKKELKRINLITAEHGKYYYCIKNYFCGGRKCASKGDVVQALRGLPIMGLEDISEYFLPVNNVQNVQKPTWSEEDERMLHEISQCIYDNVVNIGTVNKVKYIDWLKSLKERMKGE